MIHLHVPRSGLMARVRRSRPTGCRPVSPYRAGRRIAEFSGNLLSVLDARDIHFAYRQPVLAGVSLTLVPGRAVCLLGPNGSGKSTLLRCLLGQLRFAGRIEWLGQDVRTWKPRDLARRVAYLAQSPTAEAGETVQQVLFAGRWPHLKALGLETTHDAEVVDKVAADLDLTRLLPRRLDTLSGGQRQRVFVGRCLCQEPAALLLDEPDTFLDLRHQVALHQTLRTLTRQHGLAVLMASHDINLAAAFADELVLLAEGRVLAAGPPGEVLSEANLEAAYGTPVDVLRDGPAVRVMPRL